MSCMYESDHSILAMFTSCQTHKILHSKFYKTKELNYLNKT